MYRRYTTGWLLAGLLVSAGALGAQETLLRVETEAGETWWSRCGRRSGTPRSSCSR